VPRAELLERVEALAAVDIVLALYNPASRGRSEPWQAAIASLRRHRAAGTPVAAVRRAWRDGQEVRLSDVEHLDALPVDMETVVVIGSRRTRGHGRWLYTLRDEGVRTVGT
jgi:precorrin-3B methylase